jgi:uncharacterized membrane protein
MRCLILCVTPLEVIRSVLSFLFFSTSFTRFPVAGTSSSVAFPLPLPFPRLAMSLVAFSTLGMVVMVVMWISKMRR